MNISLSQKEITAAVRAYVASRGIGAGFSLSEVKFTATRGSAGIIAELTLEDNSALDVEIPGFTDRPADTAAVHHLVSGEIKGTVGTLIADAAENVIQTTAVADAAQVATPAPVEEVKSVPEDTAAAIDAGAVAEPTPVDEVAPAADATPAVNTTSLFG